ncbi:MAG TPA: prepilin-type N-terminal cleavage/methylation domain-containing protein [Gaiellaceae bacterium]|nr:prepilin-type N-terminal cleavage/methylation domain-containing protein [Gaiellaceae bacterium]
MIQRLRTRITRSESEGGFTLIELLVVIIIIGILLAIAIPSYLKFRDRANESAAKANVRSSIPAVEAYYADNNAYTGMTLGKLQASYDAGVKNIEIISVSDSSYCIKSKVGQAEYFKAGPASDITATACT